MKKRIFLEYEKIGRTYEVKFDDSGSCIVGRSKSDTNLRLGYIENVNPEICFMSRVQCRILSAEKSLEIMASSPDSTRPIAEFYIMDRESHNGTYVNGAKVSEPTPLYDGCKILLGPCELKVKIVDEEIKDDGNVNVNVNVNVNDLVDTVGDAK